MMPRWAEGSSFDNPVFRGKGGRRRFSQTHPLPLDDRLYALQATIAHLTRSSLHRCLKRHGISRLPEVAGDNVKKKPFRRYPIGYFHLDIAEARTQQGRLYLFVAIDRTSKFVFAQLHPAANMKTAVSFLVALIDTLPYKIRNRS